MRYETAMATVARVAASALLTGPALVQSATTAGPGQGAAASQPNQSESNSQSSAMGLPSSSGAGASNGVGTQASLDSSPCKASSTVAGVEGSSISFGGGSSSIGAGGTVESDPTQGGSKQPK